MRLLSSELLHLRSNYAMLFWGDNMDIYDRIDDILKEKNLSRRKLAIMAGIPPTTLQSAFSRKTVNLPVDTIKRIADALGVPVSDLAGWSFFDELHPDMANEVNLYEQVVKQYGSGVAELLELFADLNEDGQAKAIAALSDLTLIEKYQKK